MRITKNAVVSIHYSLADNEGRVVDSSQDSGPLTYVHGRDEVFPGLEKVLEGKQVGDRESFTVGPDEGFGEHDATRIMTMPRDRFDFDVHEGEIVLAQLGPGAPVPLQVLTVTDDKVVLDGNHPLAGRTVRFSVTVVDVRAPSPEEQVAGHPLQ